MPEDPNANERNPRCVCAEDPGTKGYKLCENELAFPRMIETDLKGRIRAAWHDKRVDLSSNMIEDGRDGCVKVEIDLSECGSPIGRMLAGYWDITVTVREISGECNFVWSCCLHHRFELCSKAACSTIFVDVPPIALRSCHDCGGTLYNVYVSVTATDLCNEHMPIAGYAEGGPIMVYPRVLSRADHDGAAVTA